MDVSSTSSFPHVLVIRGRVLKTNEKFVIDDVYPLCDTTAKQVLWDQLSHFDNNSVANLCLCGDFNSVRSDGIKPQVHDYIEVVKR